MNHLHQLSVKDSIYEAIFIPEQWSRIIDVVCAEIGADGGALIAHYGSSSARGLTGTQTIRKPGYEAWNSPFPASEVIEHQRLHAIEGFALSCDEFLKGLPSYHRRLTYIRSLGIEAQAGATIDLENDDKLMFLFERRVGALEFAQSHVTVLNALLPDVTRAARIASRLQFERARDTAETLRTLGLPAAILNTRGRIVATNSLFDNALAENIRDDHLHFSNLTTQGVYSKAHASRTPHSIPIPATHSSRAFVLHMIPLMRKARDIFENGDVLVILASVGGTTAVLTADLVRGLFNLTPSEARLAALMSTGATLHQCAAQLSIGYGTARSHLLRIYQKTKTGHQGELVALLKSVATFASNTLAD
jgi:DNA-binding CsgD family transcriptional regulator